MAKNKQKKRKKKKNKKEKKMKMPRKKKKKETKTETKWRKSLREKGDNHNGSQRGDSGRRGSHSAPASVLEES